MAQMRKVAAKPVAKAAPSTISQIAKRFGITAREVRDIATAVTAPKRIPAGTGTRTYRGGDTNKKETYTMTRYKSNEASGVKAQLKEAAAALTAGQKGTSVGHISASGKLKPRQSR